MATLPAYTSITQTFTFSITVNDPCLSATITGASYPPLTVNLGSSGVSSTNFFYDSVSGSFPSLLCGGLGPVAEIKTVYPITYFDGTMSNIFLYTTWVAQLVMTVSPTLLA